MPVLSIIVPSCNTEEQSHFLTMTSKSFWQTICSSFCGRSGAGGGGVGFLLSVVFFAATLAALELTSFPWCDEVMLTDTAVNCVFHGRWFSHLCMYAYNPLHVNVLTAWIWLFGASHFSVCALGVVCSFLLCVVLQRALIRAKILNSLSMNVLYQVLFWFCSWTFSGILTNGRVDMLVAFFTTLLVSEMILGDDSSRSKYRLFAYSFLMMLAAVYPVPVVAFLGVLLLALAKGREQRVAVFKKGCVIAVGVMLAFALSCGYYGVHHHLIRFVHSYFSYNGTLSGASLGFVERVVRGYRYDVIAVVLQGLAIVFCLCASRCARPNWAFLVFVSIVPVLAVVGGRYANYYSWMFYLPSVVCFLYAVSRVGNPRLTVALLVPAFIVGGMYYLHYGEGWRKQSATLATIGRYVAEHPEIFREGAKIQISTPLFYYPVVRTGAIPWLGWDDGGTGVSPREKFVRAVAKHVRDESTKKKLHELFDRFEAQPSEIGDDYFACGISEDGQVVVEHVNLKNGS